MGGIIGMAEEAVDILPAITDATSFTTSDLVSDSLADMPMDVADTSAEHPLSGDKSLVSWERVHLPSNNANRGADIFYP